MGLNYIIGSEVGKGGKDCGRGLKLQSPYRREHLPCIVGLVEQDFDTDAQLSGIKGNSVRYVASRYLFRQIYRFLIRLRIIIIY
jgi:hypothetical protein